MPEADEAMMPTSDAPPTGRTTAGLDDLERRLAAFENATKRLNRTVAGAEDPANTPPARPATRRLSDSGFARGEEISGLRPAVASQGPQTGALTARSRSPSAVAPSFTSVHGKPGVKPAQPPPPPPPETAPRTKHWLRQNQRYLALAGGAVAACGLAFLILLSRSFPSFANGSVIAPAVEVHAPIFGTLADTARTEGSTVAAGEVLGQIGTPPAAGLDRPGTKADIVAPSAGTISSRVVAPGQQVQAGDLLFRITVPGTIAAIAPVPSGALGRIAVGDRVEVVLISERRTVDGTVQRLIPAGQAGGSDQTVGLDPRPRVVVALDPLGIEPKVGQGARITVIGPRPGILRLTMLRLRGLLPW